MNTYSLKRAHDIHPSFCHISFLSGTFKASSLALIWCSRKTAEVCFVHGYSRGGGMEGGPFALTQSVVRSPPPNLSGRCVGGSGWLGNKMEVRFVLYIIPGKGHFSLN